MRVSFAFHAAQRVHSPEPLSGVHLATSQFDSQSPGPQMLDLRIKNARMTGEQLCIQRNLAENENS